MTFEDAKELLKQECLKVGFELADEHHNELYLKYRDVGYIVTEDEIREFSEHQDIIAQLENKPDETSICNTSYREQLVRPIDPARATRLLFSGEGYVFGDPTSTDTYIRIGPASTLFINYFRFTEPYLRTYRTRLVTSYFRRDPSGTQEIPPLREALFRPATIQVYNLSEPTVEAALERSSQLIESCIFGLSYLKSLPLRLLEEWPIPILRKRFIFGDQIQGTVLPFPGASYNSDIIRFYQLGMGSDIPVLQFLAFYQVLEYFFVTVSDEQLYAKLSRRINDLKHRATPNHLDRIIQEVLDHNRITDETEMLKNVINRFVDEAELIEFIQAYEEYLNDKLYTKKRERFGVEIEVKLNPGHVVGNIAKIIKTVRNALVHSSDRHERAARHVPFSRSSEIVEREVPLLRFLAEKVIIASAS